MNEMVGAAPSGSIGARPWHCRRFRT